jgi:hypothetical protein
MAARITISLNAGGVIEIWMNEDGRDLLLRELQGLNENNDHLHLAPMTARPIGDIELSSRPYRAGDKVFEWGTVLFRPDTWDREHFPHVLDDDVSDGTSGSSEL